MLYPAELLTHTLFFNSKNNYIHIIKKSQAFSGKKLKNFQTPENTPFFPYRINIRTVIISSTESAV